jgi:hypothetical protein
MGYLPREVLEYKEAYLFMIGAIRDGTVVATALVQ